MSLDIGPVRWSRRHPLLVLLLALLVLFGGLLAVGRLPIDPPSYTGYPQIHLRIHDVGVPAAIMEERVTRPLEQALADIPGLAEVVSVSAVGSSEVALFIASTRDIEALEQQVTQRLSQLREKLPATIDTPQLTRHSEIDPPVAEVLLGSPSLSLAELQKWAEESFVSQFTDIPGLDHYALIGGPVREIQVIPDQRRLAAFGLDLEQVISLLRRYQAPTVSRRQIGVTPVSAQTVDALTLRLANGDTVALSEVAQVREAPSLQGARVYRDGQPVLRLLFYRQSGESTLDMAEAFKARLAWLRTNRLIPPAVRVEWQANPMLDLKRMGRSFLTLTTGTLLLTLVAVIGLYRRTRAAVLSAVAAITSPMLVFAFYKVADLPINMLSLGGMMAAYAFVLGLPIMAFEMLRQPAVDAAVASQRLQHRLITLLIMVLLVLLPIWLWGGAFHLVFKPLVMALLATVVASVLVTLLLVPAFCGRPALIGETFCTRLYNRVLVTLRRVPHWPAGMAVLILLFIPIGLYQTRDNLAFLPSLETDEVHLRMSLPADVKQEQFEPLLRRIRDLARQTGEVDALLVQVGSSDPDPVKDVQRNEVFLRITLRAPPRAGLHAEDWGRDLVRRLTDALPPGATVSITAADMSTLLSERFEDPIALAATGDICLRVQGPDRVLLAEIAAQLRTRLRAQPGLLNIRLVGGDAQAERVVLLDPERDREKSLDDVTAARILRIARGGLVIGNVPDAGRALGVRVLLPPTSVRDGVPRLLLRGEQDNQGAIYLDEIASVQTTRLSPTLWRAQQEPMVELRAALSADAKPGAVVRDLRTMLSRSRLPEGYRIVQLGAIDSMQHSLERARVLLCACVILLPLLLGARLRSVRAGMMLLANLLFAFAGGVLGMLLSGTPWSLPMVLGMVLTASLAASLSLLTLDTLRAGQHGAGTLDAGTVLQICRPTLIFGLAGLLSLLPLASGLVPGFELLQSWALLLGAGLFCSLLASLLLIPALYPGTKR